MTRKIIGLAIGLVLAASTAAAAQETIVVNDVHGAEGPLYVDGNLYFVGWVSNTLSKWDGKTVTVLNHTPGCGHNGLALTKQKTFLIACDDEQGAIIEVDMTGKELRRWDADGNGQKLTGGINDIVVTANGGGVCDSLRAICRSAESSYGKDSISAPGSQKWMPWQKISTTRMG